MTGILNAFVLCKTLSLGLRTHIVEGTAWKLWQSLTYNIPFFASQTKPTVSRETEKGL